jgi:antirestriction protein ArdC
MKRDAKKRRDASKPDIYAEITHRIVEQLEQGTRPWIKPWNAGHAAGPITRPLRHNGKPYQGINVLVLWMEAEKKGYAAPIWMTFRQAQELGGHVRKGEHGTQVVYANAITRTEHNDATGEDEEHRIPYMKAYHVFNVEQIEGLPAHYYAKNERLGPLPERIAHAEAFFANTGARVEHGGDAASYFPDLDFIRMPPFETFRDAESYYDTRGHETLHWTRHPSRLNRDFGRKRWGDEGYAMEELVAEIGSAFLCADLGLALEPREDHAAYVESWLKVLKNDKRAIFTASAAAQKAATYLHSLQPGYTPDAAPDDPETPEGEGARTSHNPQPQGRSQLARLDR